jgi:endogenous inhibitor of DNA gyrase (YacG/DUF329 family)
MMTIDEFKASASRYSRGMAWALLGSVLAVIAFLGLVAMFRDPLRDIYTRTFGGPGAEILVGLSPFPAVLILIGSLWYAERRLLRDVRLKCPSCGKQIVGMRHLVIATRNCPHCGRRVLQEPDEAKGE